MDEHTVFTLAGMTYSSMQPRPARAEDFSAIVAWPQDAIELRNLFPRARWPADLSALAAHLAEHSDGLVLADHRDQPIAYASFYNVQQSGRVWIGHLIIHPAWRRQGLGARMLKEMEALARETFAATELATICFADNVGARVFYQRQGFRAEGWETRLDHREESVRVLRLVRPLLVAAVQAAGTAA